MTNRHAGGDDHEPRHPVQGLSGHEVGNAGERPDEILRALAQQPIGTPEILKLNDERGKPLAPIEPREDIDSPTHLARSVGASTVPARRAVTEAELSGIRSR